MVKNKTMDNLHQDNVTTLGWAIQTVVHQIWRKQLQNNTTFFGTDPLMLQKSVDLENQMFACFPLVISVVKEKSTLL